MLGARLTPWPSDSHAGALDHPELVSVAEVTASCLWGGLWAASSEGAAAGAGASTPRGQGLDWGSETGPAAHLFPFSEIL